MWYIGKEKNFWEIRLFYAINLKFRKIWLPFFVSIGSKEKNSIKKTLISLVAWCYFCFPRHNIKLNRAHCVRRNFTVMLTCCSYPRVVIQVGSCHQNIIPHQFFQGTLPNKLWLHESSLQSLLLENPNWDKHTIKLWKCLIIRTSTSN